MKNLETPGQARDLLSLWHRCRICYRGRVVLRARRFTILIIPEGSHQVRRFRFRRGLVHAFAASLGLILLGIGVAGWSYLSIRLDQGEFARLKNENQQQKIQLAQLKANLETVNQELSLLAQNDAKVRVMAQLTPSKVDGMGGVGGAPEAVSQVGLSDLQRQIDEVRQQIDLRRQSQEEIQSFLNDQRSLAAAKPSGAPVKGWLTSLFGMRNSPFSGQRKMHEGVDIAARTGTPVSVTADGIVTLAETTPGYGKLVVVDHGYGYKTYYAHNSKIFVHVGQRVTRGETISAVGNTGSSTGSHVHYEVRRNGVPINPRKFL